MHFSVRAVLQSERVLNIFNMVISGMKTQFYTLCMKSNFVRITNSNIYNFTVLKKWIFAILIHSAWRIHSGGNIYIYHLTF